MPQHQNWSADRSTVEWSVCRRLLRLLIELDDNMIERCIVDEDVRFYCVISHDQGAMQLLVESGIVRGGGVSWNLIEKNLDDAADILLKSMVFSRVISALVSTGIYNHLLPEGPEPFSLPLSDFTSPAGVREVDMLMMDFVRLGYAEYLGLNPVDAPIYAWTDMIREPMIENHAGGWKK